MAQVKTIGEIERERGVLIHGKINPSQEISEEAFTELAAVSGSTGLDHEFRENWLRHNGYKVTRANKINADLPTQVLPEGFEPEPEDTTLEVADGTIGQENPGIGE